MDYTPEVVDYWCRNWEMLTALAETPASAAHLLSPECRTSDKACGDGRPVGIKNIRNHGDPNRYSDIKADLSAAAALLPAYSLESQVVAKRMSTGCSMPQIRAMLGKAQNDVWAAYRSACKMMAVSLGWEDSDASASQTETC